MVTLIPDSVKKNWDEFNLPGCILLSLLFQILLLVYAPSRKRTSSKLIIGIIWLAYLFADSVANFALGLISKSVSDVHKAPNKNDDILVFWVPFLLLHFGGQDTIISFSIEDNALWLRQTLWFLCQLIVSVYIFLQSLPKNKLWLPTLLIFLAGILKYVDRLDAMYLASLDGLKHVMLRLYKSDPGRPSTVDQFNEEYNSKTKASLVKRYIAVVQYAYHFFKTSKDLIIGLPFSCHDRNLSRAFFQERSSTEALELIGVELNFIYNALFTKALLVHNKIRYFLRAMSFFAVFVSLVLFHKYEKHGINELHVGITYTLLFSAIALDLVSAFMLILSDWTIVTLPPDPKLSCVASIVRLSLEFKTSRWYSKNMKCARRWSGLVSSFNFLNYSIEECKWKSTIIRYMFFSLYGFPWFKRFIDSLRYGSTGHFSLTLWESLFTELKRKSMLTDSFQTGQKVCSGRGDWTLQNSDCTHLVSYIIDYGYDQSILLWRIATDLCYVIDWNNGGVSTDESCRIYSRTLSGYMMLA